ncbi:5087_t:CDS:2, partial [Funneliformis caledonium]
MARVMSKFIGEECETQINPELKDGKCLHILVTHDETIFQSNNGQKSAHVIINPEKNFDGWWNVNQLIDQ